MTLICFGQVSARGAEVSTVINASTAGKLPADLAVALLMPESPAQPGQAAGYTRNLLFHLVLNQPAGRLSFTQDACIPATMQAWSR